MSNTFYIGDTHFAHANILRFVDKNDKPIRNFVSLEEMHDHIIKKWNSVVQPNDTVYHMGDVCFGGVENLKYIGYCNGKKILVRGNHDHYDIYSYLEYFDDVQGMFYKDKMILSHMPVYEDTLIGKHSRFIGNVHGHLHDRGLLHPLYYNCSVEALNYTPVAHEEVVKILTRNKERFNR